MVELHGKFFQVATCCAQFLDNFFVKIGHFTSTYLNLSNDYYTDRFCYHL